MEKDSTINIHKAEALYALLTDEEKEIIKKLREMNLVKTEKIGKEVWYSLADDHVKKVFDISAEHIMEGEND